LARPDASDEPPAGWRRTAGSVFRACGFVAGPDWVEPPPEGFPADAPGIAVSLVGRNRARLPTIPVGLLGRPAVCRNWALRCFVGLPSSNQGEVD
jgi:hypothetical protein